mgnify:CR=1 FL=1|tara:strand:- start:488 stop:1546 length:1059 start_codon:yes stop_codon:yes gene_type:complete
MRKIKLVTFASLIIFCKLGIAAEPDTTFFIDQSPAEIDILKNDFEQQFSNVDDYTTLRPLYEEYLGLIGINGIFDIIDTQSCHSEAHELGKVVYSRLNNFSSAIHTCGNHCTSGCFHGVLMEMFTSGDEHINAEDISSEMNTLCYQDDIGEYFSLGTCYHGMGHAMMFLSDYDIDETLELCQLAPTETLNYFCVTGGFMEYEFLYGESDLQTSAHYPCDSMQHYSAACYRYKMSHLLTAAAEEGKAVIDVINECIALETPRRLGCFHGLGTAFIDLTIADRDLLSQLCVIGNDDDRQMCIEGAIWKIADYDFTMARDVCSYFPADSRDQEVCLKAADDGMYSLETDYSLYFQ